MARSNWKPAFAGRSYTKALKRLIELRFTRPLKIFKHNLRLRIRSASNNMTRAKAFAAATGLQLRGRTKRRLIIWPTRSDTITKLSHFATIWHDMSFGLYNSRTKSTKFRLHRFYHVSKYMSQEKFGNFLQTRRAGGFRVNKDKQKIEKFHKDLEKEKQKQKHVARENARLMAKALKEEGARKARKRIGNKKKK